MDDESKKKITSQHLFRGIGTSNFITSQTAGALTTQAGDTSTVGYLVIP